MNNKQSLKIQRLIRKIEEQGRMPKKYLRIQKEEDRLKNERDVI